MGIVWIKVSFAPFCALEASAQMNATARSITNFLMISAPIGSVLFTIPQFAGDSTTVFRVSTDEFWFLDSFGKSDPIVAIQKIRLSKLARCPRLDTCARGPLKTTRPCRTLAVTEGGDHEQIKATRNEPSVGPR